MRNTGRSSHQPCRPSWLCACCGKVWPCDPARVEIAESYAGDRVGMATYMVMQLHLVAGEAAFVTPQELYERFVAWTRPGDPALVLAMWAHGPEARMS